MVKSPCSPEDILVILLAGGWGSCEGVGKLNPFYLSMAPVGKCRNGKCNMGKQEWALMTPSFLTCHVLDTLKTLIYIQPYFHDSLQVKMSTSKRKKRNIDIGQVLHYHPALRTSCGADFSCRTKTEGRRGTISAIFFTDLSLQWCVDSKIFQGFRSPF